MPAKGQILTADEKERIWPVERRERFSELCKAIRPKGEHSHEWKGGKPNNHGRVMAYCPGHPRAMNGHYVFEHVLVAEKALGKSLPPKAKVHHVDKISSHNEPTNLVICEDQAYHMLIHRRQRILEAGGSPSTQRICSACQTPKDFSEFYGASHRCKACDKIQKQRRKTHARSDS